MWAHLLNTLLGIWLTVAPSALGYDNPARDHDHIAGPMAVTFAVIAWWECTRRVGRANLLIGLWLLLAPWVLGYDAVEATINSMMTGALLAALSLVTGTIEHRFGGGWKVVWRGERGPLPDTHTPRPA